MAVGTAPPVHCQYLVLSYQAWPPGAGDNVFHVAIRIIGKNDTTRPTMKPANKHPNKPPRILPKIPAIPPRKKKMVTLGKIMVENNGASIA